METNASQSGTGRVCSSDWLLIAIPGIIWGASFLFIAEGLRSIGPIGVSFMRIVVGFLSLSFFSAARKSVDRSAWPGIGLLGVLWFAFPLSMFPFAEQRVSSAITGMLNAVTPIFVAIVATSVARKLPSRRLLLGLFTGLAGSVLVALPSVSEGRSSGLGVALILAASLSYGFALNLARSLQQQHGALPVIWRALGAAAILTAPLGLRDVARAHWTLGPLLCLLALGAFGTGIAFVLLATASGRVGATRASGAAFLMPPVALLLGLLVRGEHVVLLAIVGSMLCVAGAWGIRPRLSPTPQSRRGPLVPYSETLSVRN